MGHKLLSSATVYCYILYCCIYRHLEMIYIVPGGALNSTHSLTILERNLKMSILYYQSI